MATQRVENMTAGNVAIARAAYEAYVTKDRPALERLIGEDFHFTSPLDNRLDRERLRRDQFFRLQQQRDGCGAGRGTAVLRSPPRHAERATRGSILGPAFVRSSLPRGLANPRWCFRFQEPEPFGLSPPCVARVPTPSRRLWCDVNRPEQRDNNGRHMVEPSHGILALRSSAGATTLERRLASSATRRERSNIVDIRGHANGDDASVPVWRRRHTFALRKKVWSHVPSRSGH
jgi:hypothetical protein